MGYNFLSNNLKVLMVREARQGREEAHRIRSEAFLIKKGAGTCLYIPGTLIKKGAGTC